MKKVLIKTKKSLLIYSTSVVAGLTFGISAAHADPPPYQEVTTHLVLADEFRGVSVDTDPQGNIYVATTSEDNNGSITKYASGGQFIWKVEFDPGPKNPAIDNNRYETEGISALAIHPNGYIYATGEVYSEATGIDCALKKFDSNGNLVWTKTYDFNEINHYPLDPENNDLCHDIAIGSDDHVYTAGVRGDNYSTGTFLRWTAKAGWLVNGNENIIFGPGTNQITDIAISNDGYAYVLLKFGMLSSATYHLYQLEAETGYRYPGVFADWGTSMIAEDIVVNADGDVFVGGGQAVQIDHGTPEEPDIRTEMAHSFKKFSPALGDPVCENIDTYAITYLSYDLSDRIFALTTDVNDNIVAAGSDYFAGYNKQMAMSYDKDDCSQMWDTPLVDAISHGNRAFDVTVGSESSVIMTGVEDMTYIEDGYDAYTLIFRLGCAGLTDQTSCETSPLGCMWLTGVESGMCIDEGY